MWWDDLSNWWEDLWKPVSNTLNTIGQGFYDASQSESLFPPQDETEAFQQQINTQQADLSAQARAADEENQRQMQAQQQQTKAERLRQEQEALGRQTEFNVADNQQNQQPDWWTNPNASIPQVPTINRNQNFGSVLDLYKTYDIPTNMQTGYEGTGTNRQGESVAEGAPLAQVMGSIRTLPQSYFNSDVPMSLSLPDGRLVRADNPDQFRELVMLAQQNSKYLPGVGTSVQGLNTLQMLNFDEFKQDIAIEQKFDTKAKQENDYWQAQVDHLDIFNENARQLALLQGKKLTNSLGEPVDPFSKYYTKKVGQDIVVDIPNPESLNGRAAIYADRLRREAGRYNQFFDENGQVLGAKEVREKLKEVQEAYATELSNKMPDGFQIKLTENGQTPGYMEVATLPNGVEHYKDKPNSDYYKMDGQVYTADEALKSPEIMGRFQTAIKDSDIKKLQKVADTDPQAFVRMLQNIGKNPETFTILKKMNPKMSDAEIDGILTKNNILTPQQQLQFKIKKVAEQPMDTAGQPDVVAQQILSTGIRQRANPLTGAPVTGNAQQDILNTVKKVQAYQDVFPDYAKLLTSPYSTVEATTNYVQTLSGLFSSDKPDRFKAVVLSWLGSINPLNLISDISRPLSIFDEAYNHNIYVNDWSVNQDYRGWADEKVFTQFGELAPTRGQAMGATNPIWYLGPGELGAIEKVSPYGKAMIQVAQKIMKGDSRLGLAKTAKELGVPESELMNDALTFINNQFKKAMSPDEITLPSRMVEPKPGAKVGDIVQTPEGPKQVETPVMRKADPNEPLPEGVDPADVYTDPVTGQKYVPKEPKESWQMTRDEFYQSKGFSKTPSLDAEASHWYGVQQALKENKPVPTEVLKDYPDLAKQYGKGETVQRVLDNWNDLPAQDRLQWAKDAGLDGRAGGRTLEKLTAEERAALESVGEKPSASGEKSIPTEGKLPSTEGTPETPQGKLFDVKKTTYAEIQAQRTRPPETPGAATYSELNRVESMWGERGKKTPRDYSDAYLKAQEQLNDRTFGLRKLQDRAAKSVSIQAGGPMDLKTMLSRAPGAANAGIRRYKMTLGRIAEVAPDVAANDINTIVYANHAKEILAEKGEGRVMAGFFTDQVELDTVLSQLKTKMGADKYARAESGAKVVQEVYQNELTRMIESGLIDEALGAELRAKYPWYNPLQYIDDAEKLGGKSTKPFTVIASGLKRLSEEGTAKAAKGPLDVLADQLVKNEVKIQKNETARAIINLALTDESLGIKKISTVHPVAQVGEETVFRPYAGDIPGTLSFFEKGKRQVYEVPEWLYREADTLTKSISNPMSSLIGALNGISRSAFTTMSPPFVVSNMLNDMVAAFVRGGVTPVDTGKRLIQNLKGIANDKVMQAFELSGARQARFFGEEVAEKIIKDGGKVVNPKESFLEHLKRIIPEAGEAGEQAPRVAGFQRELDKTLPGWKTMTAEEIAATPQGRAAAAKAVELTINFDRGGYLVKSANPFVIFLNANMEGMKLPFRALAESPEAKWRLAGMGAGLAGLSAYNMSYPEYLDIPNNIRWGSVVVMLPSKEQDEYGQTKPNYLTVIPRTREWSLFFGSTTYAMEKMFRNSKEDFGTFTSTLAPMTLPFSEIPMPAVISELVEQGANWDFYRSQPIVPQSMENTPPEDQIEPWVSPTMAALARSFGQSPLRAQHLMSGLFGGAGQVAVSVPDFILNLMQAPASPDIVSLAAEYKAIKDAGEKREFLKDYSSVDRTAILSEVRKPKQTIPVVSSVASRVYPQRGGQIYQTQRKQVDPYLKAAEEIQRLNKSELTDTQPKVDRVLRKFNTQEQDLIMELLDVKQTDRADHAIDQLQYLK